jgi:hypothetical protein
MKYFTKKENILMGLFVIIVAGWFAFGNDGIGGGAGNLNQVSCDVNTVTAVAVGDDTSETVLAAYSNRAYAIISVASAETEPIFLSFDEGADATTGNGIILTATSTTQIEFGLNTDFPYVGAVTGITGTASTTVAVTECRY